MKIDRSFHIPTNAEAHHRHAEVNADVYFYRAAGRPAAVAFRGRKQKPSFRYRFHDDDHRQQYVDTWLRRLREDKKQKDVYAAEKRNFKTDLVEGDILSSMWGWEQTNVDFYKVTRVLPSKKTIEIVQIGGIIVKQHHYDSCDVTPDPDRIIGSTKRYRINPGNRIRLTSFSSATKWSGKPLNKTSYA